MKALGCYIFGGSQTIGWMTEGFEVDTILEMTEDMTDHNAYHFTKNYPDIRILKPSEWQNNLSLFKDKYDVVFGNPPCSGLSTINKHANANNNVNNHIFEFINVVKEVNPKVFFMENAPTLVKLGFTILQKIYKEIGDKYRLTVISDKAGNHGVAMSRNRTLVLGWNRDYFNAVPLMESIINKPFTIKDALEGLTNKTLNMESCKEIQNRSLQRFYHLVKPGQSIFAACKENFDSIKNDMDEKGYRAIYRFIELSSKKKSVWDKSSYRVPINGYAPSMASVVQLMHPIEDRDFYVREYARLMGYPDDFVFYQNECKTPIVQCLAQGVPVNFIKYVASEVKRILNDDYEVINHPADVVYVNQVSTDVKYKFYNAEDFLHSKSFEESPVRFHMTAKSLGLYPENCKASKSFD